MPTKAEIEIRKEKKRMGEIIQKIENKLIERRKDYKERERRIEKEFGYTEEKINTLLDKLVKEYPVLHHMIVREMICAKIRELEEVKKIIECGEEKSMEETKEEKFIVRLYDGFDNEWIDVSSPVSKEEAQRIWNDKTKNGTQKTKYEDIDYYDIFPANTTMHYSSREGRWEEPE